MKIEQTLLPDPNLKTMTSVSGGKSSAYVAANYPSDHLVFSLVRIEDEACRYPDEKVRKMVEDRIQAPFIGTTEDDIIIKTIFDLEQFLGRKIDWVTGITFDEVNRSKGGYLPNKFRRYCTTHLKIEPIFKWWLKNFGTGKPINCNIGYRANEYHRVQTKLDQLNHNGLLEFEYTFEKHLSGRHKGLNKWEMVEWQKPCFPLVTDFKIKGEIDRFWKGKNVEFAPLNNCVGCFHRNPVLLKVMFNEHPNKMEWFRQQEVIKASSNFPALWRSDVSYTQIKNSKSAFDLMTSDFSECDSGYCHD